MPVSSAPRPPAAPLDAATREALNVRLRFYRDLGLGEFYRQPVAAAPAIDAAIDPALYAEPPANPATTSAAFPIVTAPSLPVSSLPIASTPEEFDIAARKPFPAAPPQAAPLAPEQHFAALKLIREEIGDCTRCQLSQGRNKIVFGDGDPNAPPYVRRRRPRRR